MSKALHIAVYEMPSAAALLQWHPSYASGSPPRCFYEFTDWSKCIGDGEKDCSQQFKLLLECLKRYP